MFLAGFIGLTALLLIGVQLSPVRLMAALAAMLVVLHPVTLLHLFGHRRRLRALAVVLAAAALLVAAADAAQAHNILEGTSPANGATVKIVPAAVTLTFNEPALALGTEIIITGPGGPAQSGAAVLVNNTVSEHVSPGSPAGEYKVVWRVSSDDGHPVTGTFSFTATSASPGQRAAAATAAASAAPTPASGSGSSLVLWWVMAAAVLILVPLVVLVVTRRPRATPLDERDSG
jgi:methionine-rich copper-binding protein CopC